MKRRWLARPASRARAPSATLLAQALAASGRPVLVVDTRRRVAWCNPAFCAASGRRANKLAGGAPHDVFARWGADAAALAGLASALDSGGAFATRLQLGSDPGRAWYDLQLSPIEGAGDRHGRRDGFVVTLTDIQAPMDERRAALAQVAGLDGERQRLEATLDGTQAGVWQWNVQTGEARVDARWAQISGHSLDELGEVCLRTWMDRIHPDDVEALKQQQRRHLDGRQPFFAATCRMRHRSGAWLWVSVRGRVATHDADGRPLWMVGTHLDVDAAKHDELELQRANAKLQALFDLSPVGFALSDTAQGRFLEFNEALLAMTGYGREELAALTHRDICPPECRAEVAAQRARLADIGRYGPHDTALVHKDGHSIAVQLTGIRVVARDGSDRIWSMIQNIEPEQRLRQQARSAARTDPLTGLPNRQMLMERLGASIDRARADPAHGFTLLFVDFDRFKQVNERLGHDAGDQLLRLIAERLRDTLRTSDVEGGARIGSGGNVVARFGADEFVILLHDARTPADAERVATRLLAVFAAPYFVKGEEVHSSASIGVVLADAACDSAADVLRNADMAMHEAKRAGRSTFAFFEPSMLTRLTRAVRIETALRRAIQLDQLSVVYQPIVDLETGRVSSAEALVRWHHPELGPVSPNEFIPIAEDTGLILHVGEWVLRESCRQWRRWQDEAPDDAPGSISVNVSRVQMAQAGRLLEQVAAVMAEFGLQAQQLQLEVTEREVMRDPAAAKQLMESLRAMGVRLAMDDFGTGTSSLGCLRDYPFDVIKIDKSFIDDVPSNPDLLAVIHATVTVVESLGMVSVAEGIEQEVQVGILQSLGCRYGQGYFFARPVPGDKLIGAVKVPAAFV